MTAPTPHELWLQAGGGTGAYDPQRYRGLLHEHGLLLMPGDEGYEESRVDLPCGWPGPAGEANYCRRCDLFIGYGAAGVACPPAEREGDHEWLSSHCWVCGRSREEIRADA